MSSERPAASGDRGRAGEVLDHVALVDRLGAVRAPARQRQQAQPLDQPHQDAERGGARRRSRSRRAARWSRARRRAGSPRPRAASARCERGGARRARCRRGRRSARPRRPRPPSANVVAARRSRAAKPSPSSAAGLHRVHEVVGGRRSRRAPASSPAPPAGRRRTASTPGSGSTRVGLARERAHGPALGRQPPQEAGAHVARLLRSPAPWPPHPSGYGPRRPVGPDSAPWKTRKQRALPRRSWKLRAREKRSVLRNRALAERAAIAARMPTRAEDEDRHLRGLLLPARTSSAHWTSGSPAPRSGRPSAGSRPSAS